MTTLGFQLINAALPQIKSICEKHQVKSLYVFGSACTNDFTTHSDIDFLVSFQERYFMGYLNNFVSLKENLEKAIGRKSDLIAEQAISNPVFIETLNRTKQKIYG
jgi:predicted nucleotidyltransferase